MGNSVGGRKEGSRIVGTDPSRPWPNEGSACPGGGGLPGRSRRAYYHHLALVSKGLSLGAARTRDSLGTIRNFTISRPASTESELGSTVTKFLLGKLHCDRGRVLSYSQPEERCSLFLCLSRPRIHRASSGAKHMANT
jgi:hypothetical protein